MTVLVFVKTRTGEPVGRDWSRMGLDNNSSWAMLCVSLAARGAIEAWAITTTPFDMRAAFSFAGSLRGDWRLEPHDPHCAECGGVGEINDWGPLPCYQCRPWEATIEVLQWVVRGLSCRTKAPDSAPARQPP